MQKVIRKKVNPLSIPVPLGLLNLIDRVCKCDIWLSRSEMLRNMLVFTFAPASPFLHFIRSNLEKPNKNRTHICFRIPNYIADNILDLVEEGVFMNFREAVRVALYIYLYEVSRNQAPSLRARMLAF
ncbi:MAG: hypothetical protein DRP11_01400 [Candidatus Aenigmatarchaeota archaeon]|nr:MAG: hypothetical protein DRP11_01400 [Candidatus Aenigmarchaeota archaeon]